MAQYAFTALWIDQGNRFDRARHSIPFVSRGEWTMDSRAEIADGHLADLFWHFRSMRLIGLSWAACWDGGQALEISNILWRATRDDFAPLTGKEGIPTGSGCQRHRFPHLVHSAVQLKSSSCIHRGDFMFFRLISNLLMQRKPRRTSIRKSPLRVESLEGRELLAVLFTSNFPSIQAALDAAAATSVADTVVVAGGAHDVNLIIRDTSPLTLRGTLGANPTRIRGNAGIGISLQGATNVTLQDMMVIVSQTGIAATNVGSLTLRNMNVSANFGDGLNLQGAIEASIFQGQFRNNGGDGIEINDATRVILTGPQVTGNALDGVDIGELIPGRVNSVRVLGGFYGSNGDDGLEAEGGVLDITASIAHANREDGFQFVSGQSLSMLSVQATSNLEEGIEVDNIVGSVRISAATVKDNGDAAGEDGLNVRNVGQLTIIRGNFAENFAAGIDIRATGSVVVNAVRVAANGDNGLDLSGVNSIQLQGGAYTANARHGMVFEGTQADPIDSIRLSLVQSANNGGNGMQARWVTSLGVFSSLIQLNHANGMKIDSAASVQIVSTNSLNNTQDGLEIIGRAGLGGPATVVVMTLGSYSGNDVDGIDIQFAGPVTLNRTVGYSNLDDGIEVFDSGTTLLTLTRFLLNGDDNVSIV